MHQVTGRTHRTFEEACAGQGMARTEREVAALPEVDERTNVDAFLARKGYHVIAPEQRATNIAIRGEWTIRSFGGQMFDAVIDGTPAITPGFETIAELVGFLSRGE